MLQLDQVRIVHEIIVDHRGKIGELTAYLKYGWQLIAVHMRGYNDPGEGSTSVTVYILGHENANASRPVQDEYSRRWS